MKIITKNPLILDTLTNQSQGSEIPIWLMRQAGRYLPEYRELKERYSFNQLSESPDLAAEVTIQPLLRFNELDAAIYFADILTPSKALGFDFQFNPGPVLSNPIRQASDVKKLVLSDLVETTGFVYEGIRKVRNFLNSENREIRRAMLGFAATPWTLACYLIDQGIYKQHLGTKIFAFKYKNEFDLLCGLISEVTIEYLKLKYKAGADAVQLFDTWSSLLNPAEYHDLSGKWIAKIIKALRSEGIPVILYSQGDLEILKLASTSEPNALSIDWRVSINEVRDAIPHSIALQGNIDPCLLFATESFITQTIQNTYGKLAKTRIIANLGHGILPATPVEGVSAFIKTIKNL